jgi:hypothetical protein
LWITIHDRGHWAFVRVITCDVSRQGGFSAATLRIQDYDPVQVIAGSRF